ncbi:hypothetical protein IV203_009603 [Nitzschia inconspicua]|uniref:Uncharacterized protein n=1 Tax=Nitzschia inconspicua TaxID=303405 RepID=A0A9K3KUK1_9STRA|nr:hypothetical protein IV203_009603 [Nitzschia inconspicua]
MHYFQQVLFYLCLMILVNHVRGSSRHHHRSVISSSNNNQEVERFPFEFGRPSSQKLLEEDNELERTLQEVVEANGFSLSMSMSMSIPPSGRDAPLISLPRDTATPAPSPESTSPPSGIVIQAERLLRCTGSTNTAVRVTLQVELAIGKTHFEKDLETALTSALTRKERFSMCDPSRRLTEWKMNRQLEVDRIFLSPLIVTELQQTCTAQDDSESSCRLATAEMAAFGTDDSQIILNTLDSIVKDDSSFHTELKMNGILDIRIVQEQLGDTDRGSNIDAAISESSSANSSPSTIRSRQNVTAIVLSVTAVIVLVAVIIRRGARRRRHLWYGPTMEEIYDENQCLGIQPRESFESPSDMDSPTYQSPSQIFRTTASI